MIHQTSTKFGQPCTMPSKSAELKAKRRNALMVSTADSEFLMFAETEKEKDDWIGAIGKAIVRCSNVFTDEDGVENDSD